MILYREKGERIKKILSVTAVSMLWLSLASEVPFGVDDNYKIELG